MGGREAWVQARSLFDELRRMDPPTSSAFYNALTDMLWHFGQVCLTRTYTSTLNLFLPLPSVSISRQ